MSLIAIGMNLFLTVLLVAALVMGWRLERRLRGVRDSHQLFAKAVGDLDAATVRARDGLAELRAATDEAIDLLGGRLARAREAADRLDQGLAETETMIARAAAIAERRPAVRTDALAPTNMKGLLELAETARAAPRMGVAPVARPAPAAPVTRPVAAARPAPAMRSRAFDEDLFEDVGAVQ